MLTGECAVYYGDNLERRVQVHSSGGDQDDIVLLPELDKHLDERLGTTA